MPEGMSRNGNSQVIFRRRAAYPWAFRCSAAFPAGKTLDLAMPTYNILRKISVGTLRRPAAAAGLNKTKKKIAAVRLRIGRN